MTVFSLTALFFYEKCQNVIPFKFLRVKKVEILSFKKTGFFLSTSKKPESLKLREVIISNFFKFTLWNTFAYFWSCEGNQFINWLNV